MLEPTNAQLMELKRNNGMFSERLVKVDRELWPPEIHWPLQNGSVPIAVYRSNAFVVIEWLEPNGFTRLSVNRTEWDRDKGRFRDNIGWDDLQRLKAEAGYGNVSAVELYPPDSHVLDTANVRHLFLLPSPPPFMWTHDFAPIAFERPAL